MLYSWVYPTFESHLISPVENRWPRLGIGIETTGSSPYSGKRLPLVAPRLNARVLAPMGPFFSEVFGDCWIRRGCAIPVIRRGGDSEEGEGR